MMPRVRRHAFFWNKLHEAGGHSVAFFGYTLDLSTGVLTIVITVRFGD